MNISANPNGVIEALSEELKKATLRAIIAEQAALELNQRVQELEQQDSQTGNE